MVPPSIPIVKPQTTIVSPVPIKVPAPNPPTSTVSDVIDKPMKAIETPVHIKVTAPKPPAIEEVHVVRTVVPPSPVVTKAAAPKPPTPLVEKPEEIYFKVSSLALSIK